MTHDAGIRIISNTHAEGTMMGFKADISARVSLFPKIVNFSWMGFEHEFLVHEWV